MAIGYSYPFSHMSFPARDDEEVEGSVSGDVVADGLFQEMDEGEFDDDEEEEGEDEEDADDGEGEDEGGGEEGARQDRLGGIWMTRPTARDVLRAPRMRRTFSSMGDRDIREGESGFFFGRGYATASPIPLSDLGEDSGVVADAGDEREGQEGEEDADEIGGEEEGDDESFTLDEEEYYDSSPEASPRLSTLQIRQEDARPHSSGGSASSSSLSSSDKAEST